MRKLEEFYKVKAESDKPEQYTKIAAKTVGLQKEYKVWVLNGDVHINEKGELIPPQNSPYIWLASYCNLDFQQGCCYPGNRNASTATPQQISIDGLRDLIIALENVYGQNFPAALLMLGSALLALHYESLQDRGHKIPAAIAIGNVSLGKSLSAEAALSIMGVHETNKMKLITDTQALKTTNITSLGIIIDDPSQPSEIAEKLLIYFERGTKSTATSSERPKTTFLTSMNSTCLQSLAEMDARSV